MRDSRPSKPSKLAILGILIALAALIVQLFEYLYPLEEVGKSPFARTNGVETTVDIVPTELPNFGAQFPVSESPTAFPTDSSITTHQVGAVRMDLRGTVMVPQVFVPAGSFMMGSEDGRPDERPLHEVSLEAYWIDRTEVTNTQFSTFVSDTGYETTAERLGGGYLYSADGWIYTAGANWRHPRGPGSDLDGLDTHPVVLISWEDANAFASWAGGRLPTEAEWEYAARGPDALIYPWGNVFTGEYLNFCDQNCPFAWADKSIDDGHTITAPVGAYMEGAAWNGALDMVGNVWEWVYDRHDYDSPSSEDPSKQNSDKFRILRGSSWGNDVQSARAAYRNSATLIGSYDNVGFRVAEDHPDSDP